MWAMERYYRVNILDDKMLRTSSPKKFAAICGVGVAVGAVTVLLAYFLNRIFQDAEFEVMFNLSLVFTFLIGMVNVVAARVHQGPLVLLANLLALWGFGKSDENMVGMLVAFMVLYGLSTAIFYQVFRVKDLKIAGIVAFVMVVVMRLLV
jgi:membrane associated rhomboid family serine protease